MTSQAGLMGHAPAWDKDNLDCRMRVPAAKAVGSGAPERTVETRALLGAGLQGAGMRGWGSVLVALPHALQGAGFRDLDPPLHAFSRRIVDDAEWSEAVASLVQAAVPGAVPAVEVGAALRKRIRSSDAHKRFVDAVLLACRSPRAEGLGITRYTFDEDYNIEKPRWVTLTLTVWFSERSIDAKMDAWREMRRIVDGYIVPLRDGDGGGGELRDIDGRFFISMGTRHV